MIFITLLTFFASAIGTVSGFGTSTILVPFLSLFYPFSEVLLFAGVIHLVGNVWRVLFFRKGIRMHLVFFFGIFGAMASYLGSRFSFLIPKIMFYVILGSFFVLYALFLLVCTRFKIAPTRTSSAIGGLISGFISGLFGVGGPVRAMFLTAFNLEKSVYLATVGLIGLFIDSVRVGGYLIGGSMLTTQQWILLMACIPCSFLGAGLAKKIVNKIPQSIFKKVVAGFLLCSGVYMLYLSL